MAIETDEEFRKRVGHSEAREPVKFEEGQVVRLQSMSPMIVRDPRAVQIVFDSIERIDVRCTYHVDWCERYAELLSPAPRHGDTWSNGESVATVHVQGDHLHIVTAGELFVGDAVAVARRLWEGGYWRVERAASKEIDESMKRSLRRSTEEHFAQHVQAAMQQLVNEATPAGMKPPTFSFERPPRVGRVHVTLEDLKDCVLEGPGTRTFEQLFARDPIAQALVAQRIRAAERLALEQVPDSAAESLGASFAAALVHEAREQQVNFDDACRQVASYFGVSEQDASGAIRHVHASLPWSSEQVFAAISAGDERVRHLLRTGLDSVRSERAKSERGSAQFERPHRLSGATLDAEAAKQGLQRTLGEPDDSLRERIRVELSGGSSRRMARASAVRWAQRDVLSMNDLNYLSAEDSQAMFGAPPHAQRRADETDEQLSARLKTRFAQFRTDTLPELREGTVVRREPCEFLKRVAWGRVVSVTATTLQIHWLGDSGPWKYVPRDVAGFLRDGRWRIVDPDVRPLASLANAVAAVFTTPDRETSRRCVDIAVRGLRGEPFLRAIQVALVGVCDIANLSPAEIAACISALRHWEARRPFDRDLANLKVRTNDWVRGGPWNRLQIECNGVLTSALGYAPRWDYDRIYFVYERARTA